MSERHFRQYGQSRDETIAHTGWISNGIEYCFRALYQSVAIDFLSREKKNDPYVSRIQGANLSNSTPDSRTADRISRQRGI